MHILLRLGHRIERDKRITTHLALTGRALGISEVYYSGQHDASFEDSVLHVVERFGGPFHMFHVENPLKFVKLKKKEGFSVVHLTMYGLPFTEKISLLKKEKNILFIVGGEKVESEYYQVSDYNLSVSSQPISEVSALGILLHSLYGFQEFNDAKMKVIPSERGKNVEEKKISIDLEKVKEVSQDWKQWAERYNYY